MGRWRGVQARQILSHALLMRVMLPITHVSEVLPLIADHCSARRGRRVDRDRELSERVSA